MYHQSAAKAEHKFAVRGQFFSPLQLFSVKVLSEGDCIWFKQTTTFAAEGCGLTRLHTLHQLPGREDAAAGEADNLSVSTMDAHELLPGKPGFRMQSVD